MAACSTSSTLGVPEAKKVVNPPAVSDSNGMISRDLSSAASVNLFLDFHSRMKELVSWPLTEAAKVSDVHELEPILQAIFEAMWEMKTHEYIENHYIMDQLKSRLQSRRVSTSSKMWISQEVIYYECTSCQLPISSHHFWVGATANTFIIINK